MEKKFNELLKNSIKTRRLYIGDNMVLDPNFDIKNYLTDVQKQVELEKINLNKNIFLPIIKRQNIEQKSRIYNTIDYKDSDSVQNTRNLKSISNVKKPLLSLNNLLTLSRANNFHSYNSETNIKKPNNPNRNITKNLVEVNRSIESAKKELDKIIKRNTEGSKSLKYLFNKKSNDVFVINEPKINISKAIKEIKKREQSALKVKNEENNKFHQKSKTKSNYDDIYVNFNIKNESDNGIKENIIAFDRKNENAVFEPVKIINDYNFLKELQVSVNERHLNKFISQNKQLSIDNLLLKIMNLETNKLHLIENKHLNKIKDEQKTIENNEQNFDECRTSQKKACRQIDTLYKNLQRKNLELINEEIKRKSDIKVILDENRRYLVKIEHLRKYAKFVTKVLGEDYFNIFNEKILPQQKYDEIIDYELLTKNVIKKYNHLIYDISDIEDEITTKKDKFLSKEDKFWLKFKELEDFILTELSLNEDLKEEIKSIKKENDFNLKDLRQKYEMLQKEHNELNGKYEIESFNYNEIEKRYNHQKDYFDYLLKNFYIYVKNNIVINNKINADNKIDDDKLVAKDCVKEIYSIVSELEKHIDKFIMDLKEWEKKDPKIFDEIINKRKKNIRQLKQINILKQEIKKKNLKFNIENDMRKLLQHSRKTEAPYQKPKKIVVVPIDVKQDKEQENENLIIYEDE
jgi:hypothetical protein